MPLGVLLARALGDFGGAGRVSEDEWRQKLDDAERQISSLQAQARSLAQSAPPTAAGLECELLSSNCSIRSWRRQADEAGRMLSRIYSYCEETNGAHEGRVGQVNAMASAGAAQFAGCGFSVSGGAVAWGGIDQGSWFDREAYDSCAPLIERACGEVAAVVLDNPVAEGFADWWDENGTTVTNAGKVVFGVVGVAAAVAMMASGVGAPAGIATLTGIAGAFGAAYGTLDAVTGAVGLAKGEEIDWESDFAHGIASAAGANPDAVEAGVKALGVAVNIVNVAKLPANAGRLVDSVGDLADLSKSTKSAESMAAGVGSIGATRASDMASFGEAAVKKEVAKNAIDLAEGLEDPFDLATGAANKLTAAEKRKEMDDYAYSENAALGYGC